MAITNEQIIDSMIAFYKARGLDLTYVLSDPVFSKMPAEDKILAIQKHARTIYEGSPASFNDQERARMKVSLVANAAKGGLAGATAASLVRKAFPMLAETTAASLAAKKSLGATLAIGLGIGAIGGAVVGYMQNKSTAQNRQDLRNQLANTVRDPSLSNAVGVLSTQTVTPMLHITRDAIVDRISGTVEERYKTLAEQSLPDVYKVYYHQFNGSPLSNTPAAASSA